jgi:proteasome lid subunit RPN8/RPN11
LNAQNLQEFQAHAQAEHPREACGLLIAIDGKERYIECRNAAEEPHQHFVLPAEDWLAATMRGTILAVCHSHPDAAATPSLADRSACEATRLPWYILSCPGFALERIEPCGFQAPLLGREFVHGIHDCYALVRDYYKQVLSIELPEFEREDNWWNKGDNLYLENYFKAGFRKVEDLQEHDGIIMQVRAPTANHAAVYLGDDKIMHHLYGHLSNRTVYGGYWARNTVCIVRHESRL